MSNINPDDVTNAKNQAITVYVTCAIALILWTSLLMRIFAAKASLHVLILICVLMILFQFISMAFGQYTWSSQSERSERSEPSISSEPDQGFSALLALYQVTFNLAFWIFVYNYYSLSCRIHLTINKQPSDLNRTRLLALNCIMCTYTVGFPLMIWVFWHDKILEIAFCAVASFSLIISSVFLFLGLLKLNSATKGQEDLVINKTAILWLFISSVLLDLATFGMSFFEARTKNHPYQATYMLLA